ncbi:MAG: branched-chain amino acid ABC transporter permease [Deltaproteobacteria bacterium]|nr:branched-chain amino acid ABC transporter permease [Deltaproteobacteria bacterium]MBW2070158.1 branched-chain amino acid ABC transporter permease [Deltaproteobacteria bacterium]
MEKHHRRNQLLTLAAVALLFTLLYLASRYLSDYQVRILNNTAIFVVLAVSYNLINGITGQFSLEPNAFVAIGAYTSALLTLSPAEKQLSFIIEPIIWPLSVIQVSFIWSLLAAGIVTAFFGFLMGFPVFRVRGDYLAIVTLGFGEVVRVVANNLQRITNGPLGLKALHNYTNLWWAWGFAVVTLFFIIRLVASSYGLAMKAVREDEVAAEAMGINAFRTKLLAFTTSAFFEGVAGGLLAHLITTISPTLFTFFLTFNLLIIIVAGGLGSTTGAVIGAALFSFGGEWLRAVEEPMTIGSLHIPGIPGMRMVVFSIILILLMIFARNGIMGRKEFSWDWLIDRCRLARVIRGGGK